MWMGLIRFIWTRLGIHTNIKLWVTCICTLCRSRGWYSNHGSWWQMRQSDPYMSRAGCTGRWLWLGWGGGRPSLNTGPHPHTRDVGLSVEARGGQSTIIPRKPLCARAVDGWEWFGPTQTSRKESDSRLQPELYKICYYSDTIHDISVT
jgi:hypothetical protein